MRLTDEQSPAHAAAAGVYPPHGRIEWQAAHALARGGRREPAGNGLAGPTGAPLPHVLGGRR